MQQLKMQQRMAATEDGMCRLSARLTDRQTPERGGVMMERLPCRGASERQAASGAPSIAARFQAKRCTRCWPAARALRGRLSIPVLPLAA